MTTHELAAQLLTMPDVPVIGRDVGQASNERGDDDLLEVKEEDYYGRHVAALHFGEGAITRAP